MTWPLIQRNKVEDSKMTESVQQLMLSPDQNVIALATQVCVRYWYSYNGYSSLLQLHEKWKCLEYAYRIPKRIKGVSISSSASPFSKNPLIALCIIQDDDSMVSEPVIVIQRDSDDERPSKRSRPEDEFPKFVLPSESGPPPERPQPAFSRQLWDSIPHKYEPQLTQREMDVQRQKSVAEIIAAATKAAEEARAQLLQEERERERRAGGQGAEQGAGSSSKDWLPQMSPRPKRRSSGTSSSKVKKLAPTKEEREANKEKRLLKLIGAVVVKSMSKHKDQFDHDQF